ncbi:MAG TPA: aldehyde dehydrogenase family protein [Gemmatimonadales bacterium]|jgi:acyl-CoA reductase-like NAD-dependent aldehyde dehydrogenase|nr:aldehyde dehydrogenase family protein [Gemmatimonadales bacterium]
MSAPARIQPFIRGAFTPSAGDGTFSDVNPSNPEDVVALVPAGAPDDAVRAGAAAQEALGAWRALPGPARAEHLYKWAEVIGGRREALAQAMCREVGKPIAEARGEVGRGEVILRYYAGEAVRQGGDVIPSQAPGALQLTLREPLGVVALITPWNFPFAIPLWKAAPALAFGNTVVLKPAEDASALASLIAETALQAGLPAGVFNVVPGAGAGVGAALIAAQPVRAVSFTGSAAVGATVAAACAARNIRYQTEMGGKNVVIVAADADLDRAALLTAGGAMRYAGQKCTATSRAILLRPIADLFLAKLKSQVEALPLGPVDDPQSAVGPLITARARDRVSAAVKGAGQFVTGGQAPADPRFGKGFFFSPTVVRDVAPDSPLATEEVFGPVLATFVVDDLDQALTLANRTRYGLSASLFTRDLASALQYVRRIEAGLVRVNGDTTGVDPHAPFGGFKGSSSGSREQGPAAREFYTEIKTVQINP